MSIKNKYIIIYINIQVLFYNTILCIIFIYSNTLLHIITLLLIQQLLSTGPATGSSLRTHGDLQNMSWTASLTYFSIEKCRHPQDTGIFPLIGINQLLSNAWRFSFSFFLFIMYNNDLINKQIWYLCIHNIQSCLLRSYMLIFHHMYWLQSR